MAALTFWSWVLILCKALIYVVFAVWALQALFLVGYCLWVIVAGGFRGCRGH